MNKKGILFSFMALLLLLTIIGLNSIIKEQQQITEKTANETSVLAKINSKLESINRILELDEQNKNYNERLLPFTYATDNNTIIISQDLPIQEALLNRYFDTLNSLLIFMEDSNYYNAFDGMVVDVDTVQNTEWGGDSNQLTFVMQPQCMQYKILDLHKIYLAEGSCTKGSFDADNVARYDFNITITGEFIEDFNSIQCNFLGYAGCPDVNFDSGNSLPFFKLSFKEDNCSLCDIDDSLEVIQGHFDPSANNTITISCVPAGGICTSSPIMVAISQGASIIYNGNREEFDTAITFKNRITSFEIADLNVFVTNTFFNFTTGRAN